MWFYDVDRQKWISMNGNIFVKMKPYSLGPFSFLFAFARMSFGLESKTRWCRQLYPFIHIRRLGFFSGRLEMINGLRYRAFVDESFFLVIFVYCLRRLPSCRLLLTHRAIYFCSRARSLRLEMKWKAKEGEDDRLFAVTQSIKYHQ